jgi:hypothetical protein
MLITLTDNDINNQREYKFYIVAKNKWGVGISDLVTIIVTKCAGVGASIVTPSAASIATQVKKGLFADDPLASGTFQSWLIEAAEGAEPECGDFDRYEIQGEVAVLAKLSYPEPEKDFASDCQYNLLECLAIRVIDSTLAELLEFTLCLYPKFYQEPTCIPMSINIETNPCASAVINSLDPPSLVIAQSPTAGNTESFVISVDYASNVYSSNSLACPLS